eukprot:CAMPEP_0184348552 /NCGR_PEP_ID=MMETSP1089-20130417/27734_1 /TAXON_ID=38269 ORGANISM="Gloeochaete wittrockiana, Strain SAG46.84" /NCGR_SAMPLE_ID=MMETSP1089 /ASSEMBLY_ACC=CAM_ASM_000445 /LENGTH=157 /DNA_ID=CAMNT_0026680307 /DNA_START=30 /DNA_END=503 /DNA_ORIENTATION=-
MEEQPLSEEYVRSLFGAYSNSTDAQMSAFKNWADEAIFDDPLMTVRGREQIMRQFYLLSVLFKSISIDIQRIDLGNKSAIVDNTQVYTFRLLPYTIRIRAFSTFVFDGTGKVVHHEDVWSLANILQQIPWGLGYLYYRILRSANATVASFLVRTVKG